MRYLLIAIFSYLVGSFSSSYFIGKRKNLDIREHGSGNAGSTNALRVLGKKSAILTFVIDISKGVIAVNVGRYFGGLYGSLIASFFVVMGHNFPFYLKFKGGKGVATSIGVIYSIDYRVGILCTIVGILTVVISKYVSLGSMFAAITAIIAINIISTPEPATNFLILVLIIFIIIRHKDNIKRLMAGNENKFKF